MYITFNLLKTKNKGNEALQTTKFTVVSNSIKGISSSYRKNYVKQKVLPERMNTRDYKFVIHIYQFP
jgi:hypothetical protein